MSLWKIAWRSIQQRGLASALTALSMALGVMLVVLVLSIHGVVALSFKNNSSLGYNLIVGAKGGKLQLTLNTVYYLSQPVENIPYDYYLEFTRAEKRTTLLQHSIRSSGHNSEWDSIETSIAAGSADGLGGIAAALAADGLRAQASKTLELERGGKYGQFTALAIPLCLGDYFRQFRVVGTTPDLFDVLTFGPAADQQYEFAEGRNFKEWTEENGYFETVVGATVARQENVTLGQEIPTAHGDPEGDSHGQMFTVVGILAPTGTPNDRAVFINMEGFYLMEDHAKPLPKDEQAEAERNDDQNAGNFAGLLDGSAQPEEVYDHVIGRQEPLPVEQREVTAILLRTINPIVAYGLPNTINEGGEAQCVAPIREIANLFAIFVDPVLGALLGITALVCVVSGVSILVSIYNSMSDRKRDIAVMRALGASRNAVMWVILCESVLLSIGGGAGGWLASHSVMASPLVSDTVEQRTGVPIGFFSFAPPIENLLEFPVFGPIIGNIPPELLLVPALIVLAVLVGFFPAMAAYRTDVAKSLGS